eukprot:6195098-Pleurochrysis_carterae.AAC.1
MPALSPGPDDVVSSKPATASHSHAASSHSHALEPSFGFFCYLGNAPPPPLAYLRPSALRAQAHRDAERRDANAAAPGAPPPIALPCPLLAVPRPASASLPSLG